MTLYKVDGQTMKLSEDALVAVRKLGHTAEEVDGFTIGAEKDDSYYAVRIDPYPYTGFDINITFLEGEDQYDYGQLHMTLPQVALFRDALNKILGENQSPTEITADSPEPDRLKTYLDSDGYKWRFSFAEGGWQFRSLVTDISWLPDSGWAWHKLPDSGDASFPWKLAD